VDNSISPNCVLDA